MANKTTYFSLIKPTPEEFYDVQVQNNNMDIIDENLNNLRIQIQAKDTMCFVDTTNATCNYQLKPGFNIEYRSLKPEGLTSLTLSLYPGSEFLNNTLFHNSIIFKSGATATTINNTAGVYFTGDDCENGVLTPTANKVYELGIWWNGLSFQGVVRGV